MSTPPIADEISQRKITRIRSLTTPACCGGTSGLLRAHASGISFPRLLWFGECATHSTPCSVPGYSYFTTCSEKSENNCLKVIGTLQQSSRVFFLFACFRRCFSLNLSNRNEKNNGNQQKTRLEASKPPTMFTTALTKIRAWYGTTKLT